MNSNDIYKIYNQSYIKSTGGTGVKVVVEAQDPVGVTAPSGTYFAVHFLTDCTPTAFTATGSELSTNITYPGGTVMYCDITQIICTANQAYILYKC